MSCHYISFSERFKKYFRSGNHNVFQQATDYLKGLVQSEKSNMERMAEVVPDTDEQVLQNFLTHSSWDERAVMDQVALDTNKILGGTVDSALYIDESGFQKKGTKSVGVARQWNGRLGKKENSQIGVFGALGRQDSVSIIDARLYLPKEWTDDSTRCDAAKIPRSAQKFKTKIEIALDIVRHAREIGVQFNWVGMDGLYGHSQWLLQALDDDKVVFMADVHKDQHIYLTDPKPFLPPKKGVRGRQRTCYQSQEKPIDVSKWAKQQPDSAWTKKTLRSATKGELEIEVLHKRVWLWDKESERTNCWHLIVRREMNDPNTIKFSISNAAKDTSIKKLAQMQAQRYWIERAFQDGKSHIGMAQYQARQWQSWHRHMALVMMAMLFIVEQRLFHRDQYPLLSCYDIQVLLARTLPSQQNSEVEILKQLDARHKKRLAAIEYAQKKQKGLKT